MKPEDAPRRPARKRPRSGTIDSRDAVIGGLLALAVIGGGRRLLRSYQARRAVNRLAEPGVTPAEVEAAAEHGRGGLLELFRLLDTAEDPAVRDAAGRSLARLWRRDELIAEEERAIVTRGFRVDWHARRRYPRGLAIPFPVTVAYGVPFLPTGDDRAVGPNDLLWSHRIAGAQRSALETPTRWTAGPGRASFPIDPGDFVGNGPHTLIFKAQARTGGLTTHWELDLPHVPFRFEFDPRLAVDALLAAHDDARADVINRAVRLVPVPPHDQATFLNLNAGFALRDPPALTIEGPLPHDLAHSLAAEFEAVPGRFPAGSVVLRGEAIGPGFRLDPGLSLSVTEDAIDRPGPRRLRLILTADPALGWTDPDIRSVWPGTVTTDWVEVQVVRR